MNRAFVTLIATAASLVAAPAFAASDYLLELDGVKGEAATTIEIDSWSFGACNAGQCSTITSPRDAASGKRIAAPRDAASGQASGKRTYEPRVTASQNTQSLRESPTRASLGRTGVATGAGAAAGGVAVAAGDLDGDGRADLAFAGTQPEVSGLTLHFQKIPAELGALCNGKPVSGAALRSASERFELVDATFACTTGQPEIVDNKRVVDGMPNRISMNVTTPKQTQGATFGEKVSSELQAAGSVSMTVTGQLKHTKTGHVTLLK